MHKFKNIVPCHDPVLVMLPVECGYIGRRAPRKAVVERIERNGLASVPRSMNTHGEYACAVLDDDGCEILVSETKPSPGLWAVWGAPKNDDQIAEEAEREEG